MHILLRTRLLAAGALLLVVFTLNGCSGESHAEAPAQKAPPEVGVITVAPQKVVLTTELVGRTAPHLIAEVRPQVSGIIQKRLFVEGSKVEAGQVLYQIDPVLYRAAYASADAALARAEAQLAPARLKEERLRDLVKINAVSQQEYDDAAAALKQVEAEIMAAEAARELARINLDYTEIKAPIPGHVGRSSVTTGALVKAEQDQSLVTIQQLDPIYVDVNQSSSDLLALKRSLASGQLKNSASQKANVRLTLEDGSAYEPAGTLKFSEVTVEPTTGSVTLRTLFPNPQQFLLPGMFVRVSLEEGINEQAILVPQRGVTRNPSGQAMVMLVGAEEKVESRVIKVSRTIGDSWLVTDGLEPGDRVMLEGFQKARPGTVVKAIPFGSSAAEQQSAGEK